MHLAFLFLVDIHDNAHYFGWDFLTVKELGRLYHYPYKIAVYTLYTVLALNKICRTQYPVYISKVSVLIVLMDVKIIQEAFIYAVVLGTVAELLVKAFRNVNCVLFKVYFKNDIVCNFNDSIVPLFAFKNLVKRRVEGFSDLFELVVGTNVELRINIASLLLRQYSEYL